ncbi:MAG: OB-fold domain-containing protein [Candidatus Lokiarchaeota archaeon]
MEEWVELGNKGTLQGFTVVTHSTPVMPIDPPFAYGLIRLEGADTDFIHIINEGDPDFLTKEKDLGEVRIHSQKKLIFLIIHQVTYLINTY